MNQSALPSEVGPYRVVARLGHGGMGEVFLGDLDGLRVAIKRVHPALAADAEFRERFSREVELCQRVDSSTCARFVDADLTASIPWLATEYIAGPNLKEAVAAGGALDAPQAEVVALGLAEALETEDLRVGGESVSGDFLGGGEGADNTARLVHGSVLVELVNINLQVLSGLGETKGIEATISRKGSIEPVRADSVGQPQRFACNYSRMVEKSEFFRGGKASYGSSKSDI